MTARVLLIDNYDSFTYNLAHGMAEQGAHVDVFRHDELTADEAMATAAHAPRHLARPRPADGDRHLGRPDRAPRTAGCRSWASAWGTSCSAEMHGGTVTHAQRLVHGKSGLVQVVADDRCSRASARSSRPAATTRWPPSSRCPPTSCSPPAPPTAR